MFSGIVQDILSVTQVSKNGGLTHFSVKFPTAFLKGLEIGASVAVDGVCQTVVRIEKEEVFFDVIQETLTRTTLNELETGRKVNIERATRLGEEIGGHLLSGHIYGKVRIQKVVETPGNRELILGCPRAWTKYLFSKGYVGLDGASLTLVDVKETGAFSVHLIPETIRKTVLGTKKSGDWVNLELDSQTQIIVETVERILARRI